MMQKYKDSPDWWYLAMFLIMFPLSFVVIYVWDTHLSWWAFLIAILIATVFIIPVGMIQAITNM